MQRLQPLPVARSRSTAAHLCIPRNGVADLCVGLVPSSCAETASATLTRRALPPAARRGADDPDNIFNKIIQGKIPSYKARGRCPVGTLPLCAHW
jgi:hypothetical protein